MGKGVWEDEEVGNLGGREGDSTSWASELVSAGKGGKAGEGESELLGVLALRGNPLNGRAPTGVAEVEGGSDGFWLKSESTLGDPVIIFASLPGCGATCNPAGSTRVPAANGCGERGRIWSDRQTETLEWVLRVIDCNS